VLPYNLVTYTLIFGGMGYPYLVGHVLDSRLVTVHACARATVGEMR
jgi:hypothetical protein